MTKGTVIRTIILLVALINQVLNIFGKSMLPISDAEINELVSVMFTVGASIWSWWKNNSVTREAIEADFYLKELKSRC